MPAHADPALVRKHNGASAAEKAKRQRTGTSTEDLAAEAAAKVAAMSAGEREALRAALQMAS